MDHGYPEPLSLKILSFQKSSKWPSGTAKMPGGGLAAQLHHTRATSWVSQARTVEWVAMPSYRGSS